MQTIDAFQAKIHFSSLLDKLEKGERIIITKRGYAIAQIIPIAQVNDDKRKQAILDLKKFSQQNTLGGLDMENVT